MDIGKERRREIAEWLAEYRACMEKNAEELRPVPMPEADEELFSLFEKTGNRLKYEAVYFQRRKYLAVFGCLAILEAAGEEAAGEKRNEPPRHRANLEKLEEVLEGICSEECWALPAHVDRQKDPDWRHRVDLFASETAQALSETVTCLGDRLSAGIQERVRRQVKERVLEPFLNSKPPYLPWEGCDNNWNAVCSGSVGCAALCLMQDEPERLKALLSRLKASLKHYIAGFCPDGTCPEGLSYFTYGFSYYTGFADALSRYTNGAEDLMAEERCRRIALFQQKCFFRSGRTLSFSDGDSHDTYKMGLTLFLALRYPEMEIPPVSRAAGFERDSCFRFMSNLRDVLWTERFLEETGKARGEETVQKDAGKAGQTETQMTARKDNTEAVTPEDTPEDAPAYEPEAGEPEENTCQLLPDAQWCICRGSSGGGMACKGGHNGESHNHNDVGSFFYLLGDEMLLTDLGAGEYTKEYFREGRYDILCNNSLGHNLPILDGCGEKEGREYGCDSFDVSGGRIAISFGQTYGNDRVKALVRTLRYAPDTEKLEVEDVLTPECGENPVSMKENLVTQYPVHTEGDEIFISGKKYACRIRVEGKQGDFSIKEETHSNHQGEEEKVFRICWETAEEQAEEGMKKCRFVITRSEPCCGK